MSVVMRERRVSEAPNREATRLLSVQKRFHNSANHTVPPLGSSLVDSPAAEEEEHAAQPSSSLLGDGGGCE